jgi:hypothetical protein
MNKMKAIIKQFFLHGVGNRFFQSAKGKFKLKIFKNEGQELRFYFIFIIITSTLSLILKLRHLLK